MGFTVSKQLETRFEAVGILQRFVNSEKLYDNEEANFTELHTAVADMVKEMNLSSKEVDSIFGPMLEVYDYVTGKLQAEQEQLDYYFEKLAPESFSLGKLIFYMERDLRYLPKEQAAKRPALIQNVIADYVSGDGVDAPSGKEDCLREVMTSDFHDSAKLKLLDLYFNYEDHLSRCGKILDEAELLVRAKQDILIPQVELCCKALGEEDSLINTLEMDFGDYTITPTVFNFSTLEFRISEVTAEKYGVDGPIFAGYGILIDYLYGFISNQYQGTERLLRLLKSLDDKTRLQVMAELKKKPLHAHEIVKMTGRSAATVSHHMNELFNKDYVTIETQGTSILYRARPATVEKLIQLLQDILL